MSKYKYTALKDNKTLINGEIEALDLRDAREKIRVLGFIPTKVYSEEAPKEQAAYNNFETYKKSPHLSLAQKIAFTSELQVLLSAGIPIIDALHNIEVNSPDKKIKDIAVGLKNSIISGKTFAQSMESLYQNTFGSVYTGLMRTGEESGELDLTLERMLVLLRKQESIKGRITKASIYPAFLILFMLGLLILFAKFVFPSFAGVMSFNGAELPLLAQAIMGAMNFINQFWWLILIGVGAIAGFLTSLFKNPKFKILLDEFVLKIPVVSDFMQYINLSNFMTVLHISYEAGVPLPAGLELANKTVGNLNIKSKIFNAISIVKSGKSLTEAFNRTHAIPDAFISMISAGETSGTLGKMFHDAADVIDKKVDMALEAMTRLFEPTVIVILGGVILIVAVAFYQAYFGMLGSLF